MMKDYTKKFLLRTWFATSALFMVFGTISIIAQAINTKQNYIRVDQFGYLVDARKIAIIAKAEKGFNAGAGINLDAGKPVTLRKVSDDSVVFESLPIQFADGAADVLSGDSGWWFNFTSYCVKGEYYVQVTEQDGGTVNSNTFILSKNVYDDVLRVAMETFFYQRVNQNKTAAFGSGGNWVDSEWYNGLNQDTNAQFLYGEERRDVSKGWIDAGDPNKYVTFATAPVHNLLTTYQQHPDLWKRLALRIPESGNDLPDLLDEIKWELDWIKKMQNPDGTVHSKTGILEDFNYISPPSIDTRARWYAQTCPAAAITAAGILAHGALVLQDFNSQADYASELLQRAQLSWDAYIAAPDKAAVCDNGEIEAGDADGPGDQYLLENVAEAVTAAVYLFALTNDSKYNDFIRANYTQTRGFVSGDWGIYRSHQSEAILYYAQFCDGDAKIKKAIIDQKKSAIVREPSGYILDDATDFYQVNPFYLNWGSNSLLARQGTDNYDYITYGLDMGNQEQYEKTADGILHYFHGMNPLGIVYLSNMYSYGAEFCADQLWHTWFNAGSKYDGRPNQSNGIVGPAPGFVIGGANPQANGNTVISLGGVQYSGARLSQQPGLKAFSDENNFITGASESPWALVEPAIYYQTGYIKLLANYVAKGGGSAPVPDNSNVNPTTAGVLEVESVFSVLREVGENGSVGADTSDQGASNGGHVILFDEGDALTFDFDVAVEGSYEMALRLRVGEFSGTEDNLANSYSITLDGNPIDLLTLDVSTLSELDGDTYWGELKTADSLAIGTHTITITALRNWLKADRFAFDLVVEDPELVDDITGIEAATSVIPGTTTTVLVNYTANESRNIIASFQLGIEPYTVYDTVIGTVEQGSGTIEVSLDIPFDIDDIDDAYQFQVFIAPIGGSWPDRIDNLSQDGVNINNGDNIVDALGVIEIEDVFEIVNEAGSNNTIGVDSFNPEAGNGLHVRLFDLGDELRFDFQVPETGSYDLSLRLRAGEASGTETNLTSEYEILLNEEVSNFELDEESISALDIDTYWGDLKLTVDLELGNHTINIKALLNWLKVDRFRFELVQGDISSDTDAILKVEAPDVVAPGTTQAVGISYSASAERDIVVLFQQGVAPYTVYTSVVTPLVAGNGTLDIAISIPPDVAIADDTYQFQVFIVPTGGTWPDRLDDSSKDSVDVSKTGQDDAAVLGDNIINLDGPLSVEQGSEAIVSIEYSSSGKHEIVGWFQLAVEPYTIFDSKSQLVSEGSGSVDLEFVIDADAPPSITDYQFQILIVPPGGAWPERLDNMALAPVEVKISNVVPQSEASFYPNPAVEGQIYVDANSRLSYKLVDYTGRVVLEGRKEKGDQIIFLNNINAGLYVFETVDMESNRRKSEKIIIR